MIAAKKAGVLRIQKDHLQTSKKAEIAGERVEPIIAPILEPVMYRLVAVPLSLGWNQRNTIAAPGGKIHPAARPHRVR